jgi:hypothetical protein
MLKQGMHIKHTKEGNYHTWCWWKKQENKDVKAVQPSHPKLYTEKQTKG